MASTNIEIRKSNPFELGSCTNCGHGGMNTKNRKLVKITEVILKGMTFRLCSSCKTSLRELLA